MLSVALILLQIERRLIIELSCLASIVIHAHLLSASTILGNDYKLVVKYTHHRGLTLLESECGKDISRAVVQNSV